MAKWKDEPWINKSAIAFLEKILHKDSVVLEIGSGSSTIWIAKKVKHIVSYEHQRNWYEIVKGKLKKMNLDNCLLKFKPDYTRYGVFEPHNHYGLVFVDGRSRVLCLKMLWISVSPGGYILLDDSERSRYSEGRNFLDVMKWEKEELEENGTNKKATAWRRP